MQKEAKHRLTWIRLYQETYDAGLVCRRCGISGPTLRKRLRRYQELRRQHQDHLRLEAIHTVLKRLEVPPLRRPKRPQAPLRYNAALPGERVQMDTMKLATGLYQYTFIDDCARYLVAALYSRRTAANTLDFFDLIFGSTPIHRPPARSSRT